MNINREFLSSTAQRLRAWTQSAAILLRAYACPLRAPYRSLRSSLLVTAVAVFASLTFSLVPAARTEAGPTVPTLAISTMPLNVVVPTHPEVMIAVTNSMSMDSSDNVIDDANKDLTTGAPGSTTNRVPTSAIMTWSGYGGWNGPNPTTSPLNYSVPTGFTPPITGGSAGSSVPYTTTLNSYSIPVGAYYAVGWNCVENATVPNTSAYGAIKKPNKGGNYSSLASVPAPTNPAWPSGEAWNSSGTWWYNGTTDGINGTGYYSSQPSGYYTINPPPASTSTPPPAAAINFVPSERQTFHGGTEALALNRTAGLAPVGMGIGGNPPGVITNTIGVAPPQCGPGSNPYRTCPTTNGPPTTKSVCDLYAYSAIYTAAINNTYTPYGDNSPSRMNIAKASIDGVIAAYGTQVNFGLMTYKVSGAGQNYYSWEYYMSPAGGFTATDFSSTYQAPTYTPSAVTGAPPVLTSEWVNNPCYNNPDNTDCKKIADQLAPALGVSTGTPALNALKSYRFMQVAHASDDPSVNDLVLSGWAGVYKSYLGSAPAAGTTPAIPAPIPATPYPPSPPGYTLQDYNCGGSCTSPNTQVMMEYPLAVPSLGGNGTYDLYPTNSGYVPYSPQVILSFRGLPWDGTPSANSGSVLVPVQAAAGVDAASQQVYLQKFAQYLTPENTAWPCSNPNADTVTVPSSYPGATPAISYCAYYQHAITASATQSPTAGMLTSALSSGNWPTVASSVGGCIPPRYVILITDGLPTEALDGTLWPPPGSAAAAGYGANVNFNDDGTVDISSTNNKALTDTITAITNLRNAGIKTFVVGMGPGANPALNPTAAQVLKAMAIAGGTRNYYPGTSPAAVVAQLNSILNVINALNVASVSGAVNTTALNTNTVVYQASFTGYDTPYQDWTGNVQAYPVTGTSATDLQNGIVSTTPNWSAQTQLDAQNWDTGRLIVTCGTTPDGGCASGASSTGTPFRWSDLSAAMQSALDNSGLGTPTDALGQDRLDYLRGDTSNYGPGGDDFRPRSHILGDIVDSAALYVAASNGQYDGMSGYASFMTQTQSRTPMIYVGANDGMLHAFNAATGNEVFAFVPNGVFSNISALSNPNYNGNHQFYVDGSPTAGDVQFSGGSWHTLLAGGLNDGGNSIYALDVTSPPANAAATSESTIASDVLWEITNQTTGFAGLGLTYSQPVFALTSVTSATNANPNGFLLFFGSGYNNADGNDYLYAVNPQTGKLVQSINLCAAVSGACNSALANGLSGVTVINNDGAVGQAATTVYAGDLQGNLWKINISDSNPANWTVTRLFQACYPLSGGGCTPQPITTTPVVSLNPEFPSVPGTVVYFGTGEYLTQGDITNTAVQSFYGILDNGSATNITRPSLVQQTLSATNTVINGNNVTLRTVTNNNVNWNTDSGWYMDLPITGERVVTNPRLYNGEVVFTTYVPSSAAMCSGGGQSFLMVLNYQNGGSFPQPQLDLNSDGELNAADQTGGQNPVGISLGNVYASAPTILASNIGSDKAVKLTTVSTPMQAGQGNFISVGEAGGNASKLSWTQLR